MATWFQRVGGEAAIEAAVVRLYERLVGDPLLAGYFEHLELDARIAKQLGFTTMALGDPSRYTGQDPRAAQRKLPDLGDARFDAVA